MGKPRRGDFIVAPGNARGGYQLPFRALKGHLKRVQPKVGMGKVKHIKT
jgi:hypothetical protein